MKFHKVFSLFLTAITASGFLSCDDPPPVLDCDLNDKQVIYGIWNHPRFISSGDSCYLNECLDLNFELNPDSSYQLAYIVSDSSKNQIIREFNDRGNFVFNCNEAGNLNGKFSFLTYTKGQLILKSDSLAEVQWDLEWNGVEGLVIKPEYLGFTHDAYILLNHK